MIGIKISRSGDHLVNAFQSTQFISKSNVLNLIWVVEVVFANCCNVVDLCQRCVFATTFYVFWPEVFLDGLVSFFGV